MIGTPLPRFEDQRLVRGLGRYTDDIDVRGQLYASFVRSPHAHARIVGIDTEIAAALPGVAVVLLGRDYVNEGLLGINHLANPIGAVDFKEPTFTSSTTGPVYHRAHWPLAVDKVRHVGEAVAMVVAGTPAQAREAAEQVMVDYEILDAVVAADAAIRSGAPQLWDDAPFNLGFQIDVGDRAASHDAFLTAHHVVRREFRQSRIVNCQMEPRSAIGEFDAATGNCTLISGSQGSMRIQTAMCGALKLKPEQMRVICPDVGGGFGPRTMLYIEQLAVVWAARRIGRPVKWTGDRSESFLADYQGRDGVFQAAIAFDIGGRIMALDHHWTGNVGAHPVSYVPIANGTRIITTMYYVPTMALRMTAAFTNTTPTVPYRGAGRPECIHMMERLLDIAADEMGMDRIDIRRINLLRRDQLPYATPMGLNYDSGDFIGNMERAVVLSEWATFEQRRKQSLAEGKLRGIGLANYIEAPVGMPRERIEMTVLPDGSVDIVSGTQSTGQGHETTFAQVVASCLGVNASRVTLRTGDTAFVKAGGGTHSDRSMRIGGTLLVRGSAQIVEKCKSVVAQLLQCPIKDVDFLAGTFSHGGRIFSLADISTHVAAHGLPDEASVRVINAEVDFVGRMSAHPTGSAVCELEVDPETGDVELLHYTSVDDVGRVINPLIVEGQVHGGLAQGIGQALSEGYFVDAVSGQVLSGSYMDYGVPRAGAIPRLSLEFTEDPTLGNPLGVKGGGESGITPATAAIFNALSNALTDYRKDRELGMPATSEVVWQFIHCASHL